MDPITFDEIPLDWLEPDVFMEVKPNYRTLGILPYPVKNIIVAPKLATGTLAPLQATQITQRDQGVAMFGEGSIGAAMVRKFFKANTTQPIYVMAQEDVVDDVAATGTITFTGALAASFVMRFKVAGVQIRATLSAGASVTQMATALKDAINAEATLPVTAASALGVVTVTSRHKGEVGNEIDLAVDVAAQPLPSGLGVAIVAMAGGTGNPDIEDAFDAIDNGWFTALAHPYADATNLAATAAWLRERYKATAKLDCHGHVGKRGTFGQLQTWGNLVNSPFLSLYGLKGSPTPAWEIAAAMMGLCSFHLANDPARQLRSLVVPGAQAPSTVDQFTTTENDLLLRAGVSTFRCLADGAVTVSRVATSYKTSNLGVLDRAWLDIMVPATMSRIRYDWSGYVSLLYPRSKLTDDEDTAAFVGRAEGDEDPGNAVVTPRRMKGSWAARCGLYKERVWIENVDQTVRQSVFQRDGADRNRLNARQQIQIVGNLMVLAGSLEFQV